MTINEKIASELGLRQEQVDNTIGLLDEGMTIPFISRYRKEVTGSLDDQQVRTISERVTYLRNLDKRREEILGAIDTQGKLTDEIRDAVAKAETLVELDDIYRPYRPKRKTRASVAREKGLEPLAQLILSQDDKVVPNDEAVRFIDEEKGVASAEEALQGASDIIAEMISDDAQLRKKIRTFVFDNGTVVSSAATDEEDSVYATYYEFSQAVNKITGHRVLALDRGEKEDKLKVSVTIPENSGEKLITEEYVKAVNASADIVRAAAEDSFSRLIYPSVEREIRSMLTETADEAAIKVFASNLHQLLMQQPVKGSVTLGLDPGYRTGCKVAVIDENGKVLDTAVVHITLGEGYGMEQGKKILRDLIAKYNVSHISIGNGTASRESESVVASIIKEIPQKVSYAVVSEAGASVYSASKLAQDEFPDFDVTQRSAVSIARRLQDPLAELVKIEPKAIGVGQYQHDMPQARLNEALSGVVEDCVNNVGVDLNTASHALLSYISGINNTIAKNIVAYREENGAFTDRKQLLKVSKLGPKAYEQCAGFLRIRNGKNPLDNTAVHPESYTAAKSFIDLCGIDIANMNAESIDAIVGKQGVSSIAEQIGVGVPTLNDIIKELKKPGRDPRDELPPPLMRSGDIMELKDLKPGMELVGTVRNVIDFGCFVDIGVHEDGLVHISQIADRYIKHPLDAVKVGQVVNVRVLEVDVKRGRISLTMKTGEKTADKSEKPVREKKPENRDNRSERKGDRRNGGRPVRNNFTNNIVIKDKR